MLGPNSPRRTNKEKELRMRRTQFLPIITLAGIFLTLLAPPASAGKCDSVYMITGPTLSRSAYLAKPMSEKFPFLSLHFGVALAGTRGIVYQNIHRSEIFKMSNFDSSGVSYRNYTAARKAIRQFEDDTRENGSQMLAQVLFDGSPSDPASHNPWAILIGKARPSRSGTLVFEPLALYSIERTSTGEKLISVGSQFQAPLL